MKRNFSRLILSLCICMNGFPSLYAQNESKPIVNDNVIFEENDGIVAIEAEYFYKQEKTNIRQWYRTSKNELAKVGRDDDPQHCYGASNNAYIEILPDERVTHSDKLIEGENFSEKPGAMAIVSYRVKFNKPGRYYVWARAFSTGGEDNGVHVGLDNKWTINGKDIQWCDGRGNWTWSNKRRTKEEHCGIPFEVYLDVMEAGIHDVQFSMREDGFELDKFVLVNNKEFIPIEQGPKVSLAQGKLPKPFEFVEKPKAPISYFTNIVSSGRTCKYLTSQDFPSDGTNFYKNGKNWLAINPHDYKEAITSTKFNFNSGNYDVIFVGVGEDDGRSTYSFFINDKEIGSYNPPKTNKLWEEGKPYNKLWKNQKVKKGDKLTVKVKVGSDDGKEWTRGRWAGIVFTPVGEGETIQESPSTSELIH